MKFTAKQIEYLENNIEMVGLDITEVNANIKGNVGGSVLGYVGGSVWGDVKRNVYGDVGGNIYGNVSGYVKGGVEVGALDRFLFGVK